MTQKRVTPAMTRFSTVAEIAAMLRVSKMTVYRMLKQEELPHVLVGKQMRVPTQAVWDYLNMQFVTADSAQRTNGLIPTVEDTNTPLQPSLHVVR